VSVVHRYFYTPQGGDTMTDRYFIPAQPGFWLLELIGSDDPDSAVGTRHYPIVAWKMRPIDDDKSGRDCFAVPVSTDWDIKDVEHAPVRAPDGRVHIAGDAVYDSEEQWFEAAKKKRVREVRG
jgi:hypothetical protein